jgi:hypothetical protein
MILLNVIRELLFKTNPFFNEKIISIFDTTPSFFKPPYRQIDKLEKFKELFINLFFNEYIFPKDTTNFKDKYLSLSIEDLDKEIQIKKQK